MKNKKTSNTIHSPQYYQMSIKQVFQTLKTSAQGLSEKEAEERTKIYGLNKLTEINKDPFILKVFRQFKELMVIILIVAGGISLYLGENRDAVIMFTIVLINATIGFIQEYKAEHVMNSLKSLVKAKARVIRDGKEIEIEQSELVPGDIIRIEEGDSVPADIRIIEENTLGTNDFALTGESNPTRKFLHEIKANVSLGDRNNTAFMGTTVATGNGLGIVINTGMHTEIGRIANLSQETSKELSPLQKELNNLSKKITLITLVIGSVLMAIGLSQNFSLREAFLFGLGIAASCVPEGMPAQVSVALSLAAGRLAKKNAVVKKLSAVETLGSTHIICTDKTGTLTKNEMTVQQVLIGTEEYSVTGTGYKPEGTVINSAKSRVSEEFIKQNELFFQTGIFASNARVNPPDKEHANWYSIGDPTEAALVTLAEKVGMSEDDLNKKYPELKEFTFDSVRKRMSSFRNINGKTNVFVKGAPQAVLEKCTHILINGKIEKLTQEHIAVITAKDDEYSLQALRVLAFAYKEISAFSKDIQMEEAENGLVFLGLLAMLDPPRPEVMEAMQAALKANIRVIIITGDYALTAKAIAKKVGLQKDDKKEITVINGTELEKMSDVELLHNLIHTNLIFSRTSPEDKLRIVSLLKKTNEVVAVTGDGVNDAPALKKADIGVSMGKTGTDVAKNSSEIVLLDDSFATLVSAIKEGRTIFQNLQKTIISSLTSNGGELFAVLLSLAGTSLWGFPLAIMAVQILAVDLVGEMLPLTFLTWDPAQSRIMTEPPRNPATHIMNKFSLIDIAISGFLMGAIGYANFLLLYVREGVSLLDVNSGDPFYLRATTITYISIVLVQWINIMSRRAGRKESIFSSYIWSNKRLLISFVISLFFLLNIVYNPLISPYLHAAPLSLIDWIYGAAGALLYLIIKEIIKVFRRLRGAKTQSISVTA